jgi:hypothetical protein
MWWKRQRRAEPGTIARKKTFEKGDGLYFKENLHGDNIRLA